MNVLNFIDHIIRRRHPQEHDEHSAVGDQTYRLRIWIRTKLWAQVLIGLALGIIVGAVLGPDFDLVSASFAGQAIYGADLYLIGYACVCVHHSGNYKT